MKIKRSAQAILLADSTGADACQASNLGGGLITTAWREIRGGPDADQWALALVVLREAANREPQVAAIFAQT
jgi:hypothetical protein